MNAENDYWARGIPDSVSDQADTIRAISRADINYVREAMAGRRMKIDIDISTPDDVARNRERLVDTRTSDDGTFLLWEQEKNTGAIFADAIKIGSTSSEASAWMDSHHADWEGAKP